METFQKKIIDITPDVSLMPKIGQTGYTISQAISEGNYVYLNTNPLNF